MPQATNDSTVDKRKMELVSLSYANALLGIPNHEGGWHHQQTGRRFLALNFRFHGSAIGLNRPQSAVAINGQWYVKASKDEQAFLQDHFREGGSGGLLRQEHARMVYGFPPAEESW